MTSRSNPRLFSVRRPQQATSSRSKTAHPRSVFRLLIGHPNERLFSDAGRGQPRVFIRCESPRPLTGSATHMNS
jgi:hypothetical protein